MGTKIINRAGGTDAYGNYSQQPPPALPKQIEEPYVYPSTDTEDSWSDEFDDGPDNLLDRGWLVAIDSGGVATPLTWAGPVVTLPEFAAPETGTFRSSRSGSTMFLQLTYTGGMTIYKPTPPDASGNGTFSLSARIGLPETSGPQIATALKAQNEFPSKNGTTVAAAVVMSRGPGDPTDQLLLEQESYRAGVGFNWRYTRNTLQVPDVLMVQGTNGSFPNAVPSVICGHLDSAAKHVIMSRYTRGNLIGYPAFAGLDVSSTYAPTSGGPGIASLIFALDYIRLSPVANQWFPNATLPT
jgi:hypothetical protein